MTNRSDWDVCVVGMGYVGLTLATAFAKAGLRVAGVERNLNVIEEISKGLSPFHETGLDDAIAEVVELGLLEVFPVESRVEASSYVITVGTPVRSGEVYLNDLTSAVESVANVMPDGALVALRSTVRVGTTRSIAAPILEKSGKRYSIAMVPERTIEGKALAELSSLPQIVGGIDSQSTSAATRLFETLGVEVVEVSTPEAAELAKLASNTYRDLNFAFANELAYFADNVGIDVHEVVRACNHGYERVNLSKPGPVAGPCLEKDAYILSNSAELYEIDVPLSMEGRKTNEKLVEHVRGLIRASGQKPSSAAIAGLAFKGQPETSDVRGSLALNFAAMLKSELGIEEVQGWDPIVSTEDAVLMGTLPGTVSQAFSAELIVIQTNHEVFKSPDVFELIQEALGKGSLVIDLWNQLPEALREHPRVLTLGNAAHAKGTRL